MSETYFPTSDLLRRKFQTALVIGTLALSVASTLYLLLFAEKIGFSVSQMIEGKLTAGFSAVFSPFVLMLVVLILIAGAVIGSFMVSMMMAQRKRDIGLMKAAGCPNDLVFGYFFTEVLIVVFLSCVTGVLLGSLADLASTTLLGNLGLQAAQVSFDLWLVVIVFIIFFVLGLIVGVKPILEASKVEPARAISPFFSIGLRKDSGSKVVSKSAFTSRIAVRNLVRHRSATIKIVLCMSVVFTLVTVGVAGGLIADRTTKSWVEKAVGKDIVLVAHRDVCEQYRLLLREFLAGTAEAPFNYADERYSISDNLLNDIGSLVGNDSLDIRLVLNTTASEIQGITFGEETSQTQTVGDHRQEECLIVGIEPERALSSWFLEGRFLESDGVSETVVGDTLARIMFSEPLVQKMKIFEENLDVVGICIDPVNNGKVAYVPIKTLENITFVTKPNLVFIKIDPLANRTESVDQIRTLVNTQYSEFSVLELDPVLDEDRSFLGYIWSSVILLPLLSLGAASFCLIGYVILTIEEQRQEFGILRAVGARSNVVTNVVSRQSLIVLLSSYGLGISFGTIITLLILVQKPLVTPLTVLEIAGWLAIAFAVTFVCSLYPAVRFAKKPLTEVMRPA